MNGGQEMEITVPGRELESWEISTPAQASLVNQKQSALLCSFERIRWRVKQQMYYLNNSKIFDKNFLKTATLQNRLKLA